MNQKLKQQTNGPYFPCESGGPDILPSAFSYSANLYFLCQDALKLFIFEEYFYFYFF
jgi:hypothetical protein